MVKFSSFSELKEINFNFWHDWKVLGGPVDKAFAIDKVLLLLLLLSLLTSLSLSSLRLFLSFNFSLNIGYNNNILSYKTLKELSYTNESIIHVEVCNNVIFTQLQQ